MNRTLLALLALGLGLMLGTAQTTRASDPITHSDVLRIAHALEDIASSLHQKCR